MKIILLTFTSNTLSYESPDEIATEITPRASDEGMLLEHVWLFKRLHIDWLFHYVSFRDKFFLTDGFDC